MCGLNLPALLFEYNAQVAKFRPLAARVIRGAECCFQRADLDFNLCDLGAGFLDPFEGVSLDLTESEYAAKLRGEIPDYEIAVVNECFEWTSTTLHKMGIQPGQL